MANKNFQYHLSNFLTKEMPVNRNNSPNTISSYASTFRLFLEYMNEVKGIKPNNVDLVDITKDNMIGYLNWLEDKHKIQINSRNIRLAAIRSFVSYLQVEDVEHIFEYQKILSIKKKKCADNEVMWISKEQMKILLNSPDSNTKQGFKDKVILTVLYDTGARVDELIHMKIVDIHLGKTSSVKIKGKGNKERVIPIMGNTAELITKYMKENQLKKRQYEDHTYLFQNRSGNTYTRAGISYIINKYVDIANIKHNANITINMHPHVFRHSKAVHLLEAGIELIYIRDFLGHSSVKTTEIYAKVCTKNKIEALEKVYENLSQTSENDWTNNQDLMGWLTQLSKK